MRALDVTINIDYSWWRSGGSEIKPEHLDALRESAESRIFNKMNEGFVSGELNDNIRMTDDDPENGVEYRGWWNVDKP